MSKKPFDILVIGGGASGLTAAVCAGRFFMREGRAARIGVLERHGRPGRKLSATGNGHCNLSHQDASSCKNLYYHSEAPFLFESVLDRFTPEQAEAFFESIGILCHTKDDGKIYPFCEQAAAVVSALEQELSSLGVEILCHMEVCSIAPAPDGSEIEIACVRTAARKEEIRAERSPVQGEQRAPEVLKARRIIAATGGMASPSLSSEGLGYALLESLGHTCTRIFPSVVQLFTEEDFVAPLAGTKWNAGISLMRVFGAPRAQVRDVVRKESGELLFTKYGLSGPPILQLARFVGESMRHENETDFYAVIDFLEEFSVKELIGLLSKRIRQQPAYPVRSLLTGILPLKIAAAFIEKQFALAADRPFSSITDREMAILISRLKQFPIRITGTAGWKDAQVTAGGIRCDEADPETLESKCCKGLYLAGELLDVDGFNLQFALASGTIAGESAARSLAAKDFSNGRSERP